MPLNLGREHKDRLLLALVAGTCQALPAERNIPILSNVSEHIDNLASRITACNQLNRWLSIPDTILSSCQ